MIAAKITHATQEYCIFDQLSKAFEIQSVITHITLTILTFDVR